jgi:hypothetical protein
VEALLLFFLLLCFIPGKGGLGGNCDKSKKKAVDKKRRNDFFIFASRPGGLFYLYPGGDNQNLLLQRL